MGGWIRRGWISRLGGAPIQSRGPKLYKASALSTGLKAKSNHDGSNPHSRPSDEFLRGGYHASQKPVSQVFFPGAPN